ncbi:TetR/AcrR family transcriptional regulator [Sphingosinicella microcystinivorans]|uniref:TetR/AcrR family transcriptional regulator n=1 Tax=Sphingosinicella microcystinivorans TaxID=335406 RepID=UPI0022F3D9F0|nr:TetR/AcrR family transcriptional regulator [Sphingosinicella microcystinivorans]WBX84499.1 TetR/AcrR family transcriptional regulator [Sphingosinicella microcystinivorans]
MNAEADQPDTPRMTQDERRTVRRQAILDAAEVLFLEHGYPCVSLSAIVQRSGGSLATIYQMFGNKQGLLRAVVDRNTDESLKDLDTLLANGLPPRRILEEFAISYLAFATTPRKIAFMRLVITESLTDPDFGEAFDRDMQMKYVARIASLFEHWNANGLARIDRPRQAAELYLAILLCNLPIRFMLGRPPENTSREDTIWRLACFLDRFGMEAEACA